MDSELPKKRHKKFWKADNHVKGSVQRSKWAEGATRPQAICWCLNTRTFISKGQHVKYKKQTLEPTVGSHMRDTCINLTRGSFKQNSGASKTIPEGRSECQEKSFTWELVHIF